MERQVPINCQFIFIIEASIIFIVVGNHYKTFRTNFKFG
jgi:hypothetical protein